MTEVRILLEEDDAIVLFELLHRLSDQAGAPTTVSSPELQSVEAVICALETVLVPPFQSDYGARVESIISNRQRPSTPEETE